MPEPIQIALTMMLMMLGAGGMATLILRARQAYGWPSLRQRFTGTNDSDVKLAALKSYENLAQEKIDVLKRAIDMGWDEAQLKALDARLEQLVGRGEVGRIVAGGLPSSDLESIALSPAQELERLKRETERSGGDSGPAR
jgi:hypothetical protein